MSQLLDALSGVVNAAEPVPGLVTGGQPTLEHLRAFKRARVPVSAATRTDDTLAAVRAAVQGAVGKKALLFYCNSGNRVGATLIPYLMLDQGMDETAAEQLEWALDYVHRVRP